MTENEAFGAAVFLSSSADVAPSAWRGEAPLTLLFFSARGTFQLKQVEMKTSGLPSGHSTKRRRCAVFCGCRSAVNKHTLVVFVSVKLQPSS